MTRAVVDPGICGMTATIEITRTGRGSVRVQITSDCEMVANMAELIAELNLRDALRPPSDSEVYRRASECHLHAACPVPVAVLKTIEVEAGLALPRTVTVRFEAADPKET